MSVLVRGSRYDRVAMDAIEHLWQAAAHKGGGGIDAHAVLDALVAITPADVERDDERSRMLVRDAVAGLREFDGPGWSDGDRRRVAALPNFPLPYDPPNGRGFYGFATDLCVPTTVAEIVDAFNELGSRTPAPTTLAIAGRASLLFDELVTCRLDAIDVIEPVAGSIEGESAGTFVMRRVVANVLPDEWHRRTIPVGQFGLLAVERVDPLDVLIANIFNDAKRGDDFHDARRARRFIDRATFVDRVATTTARWRADERLHRAALDNWYVISGEETLPPAR